MKPIKLNLSAFGPYLNEIEIDFTRLQDNGLYLVSGDTGSGKTMIFDAICFALYNKTSGGKRTAKDLRTVTATSQLTFVDYTFIVNDKTMRIVRTPEQVVIKDGKEKKIKATYQFFIDNLEQNLSRDYGIAEIVGINYDEFTQIVMIAQNDFMKLINANEKERTDILKKLFKIPSMNDFNIYLKNKSDEAKNEAQRLEKNIHDIFEANQIDLAKNNQEAISELQEKAANLTNQQDELAKSLASQEEFRQELSAKIDAIKAINEMFGKLDQARQKKADLEANYDPAVEAQIELLQAAQAIQGDYQKLISAKSGLEVLLNSKASQQEQLSGKSDNRKLAQKECDREGEYQSVIAKEQDQVAQLAKQKEQAAAKNELETKIKATTTQHQDLQSRLTQLDLNGTKLEKSKEELGVIGAQESVQLNLKNQLERSLEQQLDKQALLVQVEQAIEAVALLTAAHQASLDRYGKLDANYQEKNAQLEAALKANNDHAVGFIAASLVDGEPCPVCGSRDHPRVAPLSGQEFSKEQLTKLKADRATALQELNSQVAKTSDDQAALKVKQDQLLELQQELGDQELDSAKAQIAEAIGGTKEQLALNQAYFNQLNISKEQLKKVEDELEQLHMARTTIQGKLAGFEGSLNELNDQLARMPQISNSIAELERQIDALNSNIKATQATIAANSRHFHELDNEVARIEAALEALETQITQQRDLIDTSQKAYQEKLAVAPYPENVLLASFVNLKQLPGLIDQVTRYHQELATLAAAIAVYQEETQDRHKEDEQGHQERLASLKIKLDSDRLEAQKIATAVYQVKVDLDKMTKMSSQSEVVQGQYDIYNDLYKTAKGQLTGQKKLAFETYLVYSYFEELLNYANAIFADLTNNRYQFVVSEPENKKSAYNFILGVLDRENSMTRMARTLSGGETFKAALSLSIGLSRLVQDKSGTVELNSIFIDEGFGTLDDNSLNQAINCLQSIRLDNQMIGIISHVNILKERIDNKILVKKAGETSRIEIIEA